MRSSTLGTHVTHLGTCSSSREDTVHVGEEEEGLRCEVWGVLCTLCTLCILCTCGRVYVSYRCSRDQCPASSANTRTRQDARVWNVRVATQHPPAPAPATQTPGTPTHLLAGHSRGEGSRRCGGRGLASFRCQSMSG